MPNVNCIVITLSQPVALGIVSMYVPLAVTTAPLGSAYESQPVAENELCVSVPKVRLIVMTLSQPAMLGIVSIYVPELLNTCPLGEVYEPVHEVGLIVAVVELLMVTEIVITLSHPCEFGIVSMYVPDDMTIAPLGVVYISHADAENALADVPPNAIMVSVPDPQFPVMST